MPISKRLRFEVLRRDNHTCRYCGATAPEAKLTIDHVTPTALGGADTAENLVTACSNCNNGKSSSTPGAPLVADVAQDALRWAAAMRQAAAEMEAQEGPKDEYRSVFTEAWNRWTYDSDGNRKPFGLPGEWPQSIERFRQAGLPAAVWPDIVDAAMSAKHVKPENLFRYCCGIAWRKVTALQERAAEILAPAKSNAEIADEAAKLWLGAFEAAWGDADDTTREDASKMHGAAISFLEQGGCPESLFRAATLAGILGRITVRTAAAADGGPLSASQVAEAIATRGEALEVWTCIMAEQHGMQPTQQYVDIFQDAVSLAQFDGHGRFDMLVAAHRAAAELNPRIGDYLPGPAQIKEDA